MTPIWHPAIAALMLAGAGGAANATVYRCTTPTGVVLQQTPCRVADARPAVVVPPLACTLGDDAKRRAVKQEQQFLSRYPDARSHHLARAKDLAAIVVKIDAARARHRDVDRDRPPLERELAFYVDRPPPADVQAKLDALNARYAALRLVFERLQQEVAAVEGRYRCERETYGKLWRGEAPGSSACDRPACAPPT